VIYPQGETGDENRRVRVEWRIRSALLPDYVPVDAELDPAPCSAALCSPFPPKPPSSIPAAARRSVFIGEGRGGRFEPRSEALVHPGGGYAKVARASRRRTVVVLGQCLIDAGEQFMRCLKRFSDAAPAIDSRLMPGQARNCAGVFRRRLAAPTELCAHILPSRDPRSLEHPGHRIHGYRVRRASDRGFRSRYADDAMQPCRDRGWGGSFRSFGVSFVYVIFEDETTFMGPFAVLLNSNGARSRCGRRDADDGSGRQRRRWVIQYA